MFGDIEIFNIPGPDGHSDNDMENSIRAIEKAIELKVDIINYSAGGLNKSDEECDLVKKALDLGIVFVSAAGNEKSNINKIPYYPAMCDDRVIAVENVDDYGNISELSNFTDNKEGSRKLAQERGTDILSIWPDNRIAKMTGTSQATPTYVGKLVKKMKLAK